MPAPFLQRRHNCFSKLKKIYISRVQNWSNTKVSLKYKVFTLGHDLSGENIVQVVFHTGCNIKYEIRFLPMNTKRPHLGHLARTTKWLIYRRKMCIISDHMPTSLRRAALALRPPGITYIPLFNVVRLNISDYENMLMMIK